jgi:hypothetical protein
MINPINKIFKQTNKKSPRYRYTLDVKIKSTNKKELMQELNYILFLAETDSGASFGGDSGTCYVDGTLKTR